jgi:hypothetical protein
MSRLFLGQRFDKIDAMTTDPSKQSKDHQPAGADRAMGCGVTVVTHNDAPDLEPSSLDATVSPLSESALDGLAALRVEPTRPVNDDAGTLMSLLRDEDHV